MTTIKSHPFNQLTILFILLYFIFPPPSHSAFNKPPQLHAVLISVSTYDLTIDKPISLSAALPQMHEAVKIYARKAGLQIGNIIELSDKTPALSSEARNHLELSSSQLLDSLPTRENITDAAILLDKAAASGDTIVFFFTGHGFANEATTYPTLIAYGGGQVHKHLDLHNDVIKYLEKRKTVTKLFFIDACQSAFSDDEKLTLHYSTNLGDPIFDLQITILFSSRPGGKSFLNESEHIGLFTKYLSSGLSGEADGATSDIDTKESPSSRRDGTLEMKELQAFLDSKISEELRTLYPQKIQQTFSTQITQPIYEAAKNKDVPIIAIVQLPLQQVPDSVNLTDMTDSFEDRVKTKIEQMLVTETGDRHIVHLADRPLSSKWKELQELAENIFDNKLNLVKIEEDGLLTTSHDKRPPDYIIFWGIDHAGPSPIIRWLFFNLAAKRFQIPDSRTIVDPAQNLEPIAKALVVSFSEFTRQFPGQGLEVFTYLITGCIDVPELSLTDIAKYDKYDRSPITERLNGIPEPKWTYFRIWSELPQQLSSYWNTSGIKRRSIRVDFAKARIYCKDTLDSTKSRFHDESRISDSGKWHSIDKNLRDNYRTTMHGAHFLSILNGEITSQETTPTRTRSFVFTPIVDEQPILRDALQTPGLKPDEFLEGGFYKRVWEWLYSAWPEIIRRQALRKD